MSFDDLGIPSLPQPDRFVWGAQCPICHKTTREPYDTAFEAVSDLCGQHSHERPCMYSWELSKVKVNPPVGVWTTTPFVGLRS